MGETGRARSLQCEYAALCCLADQAVSCSETVFGGRHWTRTSDLLHVKHFRLSAVLGAWETRAKVPQLYGHGTSGVSREFGGRHWTRTSDLFHVKELLEPAELAARPRRPILPDGLASGEAAD